MKIFNLKGVFVPERDVKEALKLVRDLRLKSIYKSIHPVAMRIALKFALMVDDEIAKQRLTAEQEEAIDKMVKDLRKLINE